MRWLRQVWGVGLLMVVMAQAWAQEIYTCTDAKGRKLNSDRPITECTDREQKVLGRNGTVKRVVGPVLSAQEQADYDEAQRRDDDQLHQFRR